MPFVHIAVSPGYNLRQSEMEAMLANPDKDLRHDIVLRLTVWRQLALIHFAVSPGHNLRQLG